MGFFDRGQVTNVCADLFASTTIFIFGVPYKFIFWSVGGAILPILKFPISQHWGSGTAPMIKIWFKLVNVCASYDISNVVGECQKRTPNSERCHGNTVKVIKKNWITFGAPLV